MRSIVSLIAALAVLMASTPSAADPPDNPLSSFSSAKKVARDAIYADHKIDFYCGCKFTNSGVSGGKIVASSCGYTPRANATRGKQLEWEHVVPAWFFGHERRCWSRPQAFPRCINSDGGTIDRRSCCERVDPEFKRIEADLHNLTPAVGELNGDRSNLPYGIVSNEPRRYGSCNFEIGGSPRVTEPPDKVRGDAARIWLYMISTYDIPLSDGEVAMFEAWSNADPVDTWEKLRNRRIKAAQGNSNPNVAP